MTRSLQAARILLVDDHADLVSNLAEILQSEGAVVECAPTANRALLLAPGGFDVALVDIRLPDATGLSLIPRLKEAGDGFGEVVLITGNASLDDAIMAVHEDAYAYLCKPFDPESLLTTVDRALSQVRLRREARALEQRTRIAEKLAAVGTLSAGLAHEIRNPLNAASLQLQLLERRLSRVSEDPGLHEPIAVVRGELSRLSHLVEDFLNFARPAELRTKTIDLVALAEQVVELERPDAQSRDIALHIRSMVTSISLPADREKLLQVVLNLVRNAMEAIEQDGAIELRLLEDSGRAHLIVVDDGPGIPEEILPRIFEPFFSTKAMGTGLGMAISHSLVLQHGGDIKVRSGPEGSEIELVLPRRRDGEHTP